MGRLLENVSLISVKRAENFGQMDIGGMVNRAFHDFDHFRKIIPGWYGK